MNNFRLLSSLLIFFLALFSQPEFASTQTSAQGRSVFKIVTSPTTFQTSSDIIHFKPSSYTGSPWNLVMSDILDSGNFQKTAVFWIKHNMTTAPSTDIIAVRAASTVSRAPVNPTDAHFMVSLTASGSDTTVKLTYLVKGSTIVTQTLTSALALKPYTWYGVYVSRASTTVDQGVLFVYDPSTISAGAYQQDIQTQTNSPSGYQKTAATSSFYVDIGGDSQISTACNCQITNFNLLYKDAFSSTISDILELMKQPAYPLLYLQYLEIDDDVQLVKDYSNENNVVFRGDSQFDTTRDTQLNYDQTTNGDVGHIYSQNGFDTISPAFDLGREYTVSFWIQFSARPSSITTDSLQPVFFKQNSLYPDMKVYAAFEATATTITGVYLQSGATSTTVSFPTALNRGDGTWYYFSFYFGNFYKNESLASGTYEPSTLYQVQYTDATGALATPLSGIIDDYFIHGGSTDIMRIGLGVDGNDEILYAVIKKFQIFSGGWFFSVTGSTGSYALGSDTIIDITDGALTTRISAQLCGSASSTYLYEDDCLTTCSSGSYAITTAVNTNFPHCEQCYENCKVCEGRLGTQCSDCFYGSWDPFNVLKNCPGKNPCNVHQYETSDVCQECMDQCASCKDGTTCSACAEGFSYNQATFQCEVATCGDGVVDAGEQCDDGNQFNGDGCTTSCTIETGFYCPFTGGSCYSVCGDNVQASNEQCDDGNNLSGDGCDYKCQLEAGYFCEQNTAGKVGPFTDTSYAQTCGPCTGDCATCATASTCSVCDATFYLDSTGACVSPCTGAFYPDTTTKSCLACPDLCATCSDDSTCLTCTSTNALYDDLCLDTCPDGTYNGIDTGDGLRKCLDCPTNCVTCASASQCYTCDTHYFLNSGTGSCDQCDTTCTTCRGSAATDCVLCPDTYTLKVSTSECVQLSCTSSEYANYAIGECEACDATCLTCSGTTTTDCLTCSGTNVLSTNNQCLACTYPNGLELKTSTSCIDICGDGRRVAKTTQCDDGNLVDGDGCSSTCKIETGWTCSGGNETMADSCVSHVGPVPSVTVNNRDRTTFNVSFDRKVINTLQSKEYATQILVSLEGIEVENSLYEISWDSSTQTFIVQFGLLESVIDSLMTVEFKDPSRVTDFFQNPVSPSVLYVDYPTYYYTDKHTKTISAGLASFSIVVQSINTATMIPLALTGYLAHYWLFLEFFQIVHDLRLINVRTPYLTDEFLNSFRFLRMDWLPNAPEGADINYDKSEQVAPGKFDDLYINTFFLENNGYQLTTWAFLIFVWVILKVVIKVGLKRSALKKLIYIIMLNLEWSLVLRAVIEMYYDFCIYSYLQLTNVSFASGMLGFSAIMGILGTIFTVLFPFFCIYKTLKVKNQYLLEKDIKYDTLYREFRKKNVSTVTFLAVVLLQKILLAAIIVGLQGSPQVQISFFVAVEVVMLMVLLVMKPYVDGSMNFRAIMQELILFAVSALFFGLLNENNDENVRDNVGKVIVALLILALLMHCGFLLQDTYLAFKEYKQNPDGISKNIFGPNKITPLSGDQFHINSDSRLGSSDGFGGNPKSKDNLSVQGYNAIENFNSTQGDLIVKEDFKIVKPRNPEAENESVFGMGDTLELKIGSKNRIPRRRIVDDKSDKSVPSYVGSQDIKEEEGLIGENREP